MTFTKLVVIRVENTLRLCEAPAFSLVHPGERVRLSSGSEHDVISTLDVDRGSETYKFMTETFGTKVPAQLVGVYRFHEFRGDCG